VNTRAGAILSTVTQHSYSTVMQFVHRIKIATTVLRTLAKLGKTSDNTYNLTI